MTGYIRQCICVSWTSEGISQQWMNTSEWKVFTFTMSNSSKAIEASGGALWRYWTSVKLLISAKWSPQRVHISLWRASLERGKAQRGGRRRAYDFQEEERVKRRYRESYFKYVFIATADSLCLVCGSHSAQWWVVFFIYFIFVFMQVVLFYFIIFIPTPWGPVPENIVWHQTGPVVDRCVKDRKRTQHPYVVN